MGIYRLDFFVPSIVSDSSVIDVKHAVCKQGIDFIPSASVEILVATNLLETLQLDQWRGQQGNLVASYSNQISFDNQYYFVGAIQSVHVKKGLQVSAIRLELLAWPQNGSSKTYIRNYKLFQDKTSYQISKDIFATKAGGAISDEIEVNNITRHCEVQYGESDMDFVSRILAEDHLSYAILPRVEFGQDLTKKPAKLFLKICKSLNEYEPKEYPKEIDVLIDQNDETIGAYDFEFDKIRATSRLEMTSTQTVPGQIDLRLTDSENAEHEWVEVSPHAKYPDIETGRAYALQERDATKRIQFRFKTKEVGIHGGYSYTLKTPSSFGSPELLQSESVAVIETTHEFFRPVIGGWDVEISAVALTHKYTKYTPPYRPRPQLPGLLYANVVDAEHKPDYAKLGTDDKVYTNSLAQVKVRITWPGLLEEGTNYCDVWLRMMTPWAGQHAGFLALPRVGQEVIVSFIHGDANQPIVLGCLYSHVEGSGSLPPWDPSKEPEWVGMGTRTNVGEQYMRMSADHLKPSVEIHSGGYLDIKSQKETNIHALTDMTLESTNNMTTRTTSSKHYFVDQFVEGATQVQLLGVSQNTIGTQLNTIANQTNTIATQQNIIGARINVILAEENLIGLQQNTIGAQQNLIGISNTIRGAHSELNGLKAEINALKTEINGMKAEMSPLMTRAFGAELVTVGASLGLYGVKHDESAVNLETQGTEVSTCGTCVWV